MKLGFVGRLPNMLMIMALPISDPPSVRAAYGSNAVFFMERDDPSNVPTSVSSKPKETKSV